MTKLKIILPLFLIIALSALILTSTIKPKDQKVETDKTLILSALKQCHSKEQSDCSLETTKKLLANFQLQDIIQTIAKNTSDPQIFSVCHSYQYGRDLGFTDYQKGKNVQETLKKCDGSCYEACYHGVAEAAVIESKWSQTSENDPKVLTAICGKLSDHQTRGEFTACVHGIGTGLLTNRKEEITLALEDCDLLSTSLEKQLCYGGVFEKNHKNAHISPNIKYLEANDQYYPCDRVPEKYGTICYGFQGSSVLEKNHFNIQASFPYCESLNDNYRKSCAIQMAKHLVYLNLADEQLKEACDLISNDLKNECFSGMASHLIQSGEPQRATKFCALVAQQYKQECDKVTNSAS